MYYAGPAKTPEECLRVLRADHAGRMDAYVERSGRRRSMVMLAKGNRCGP